MAVSAVHTVQSICTYGLLPGTVTLITSGCGKHGLHPVTMALTTSGWWLNHAGLHGARPRAK